MDKAIIIGAGNYGQVYAEYLKNEYDIIGFFDDNEDLIGKVLNGIKVLGNLKKALKFRKCNNVFIPIGNNKIRVSLIRSFEKAGYNLPSFIHRETIIHKSVKLGKTVYILPNTTIMPLSKIGSYNMISIGSNIVHHTSTGFGCFFSNGTNIGASISFGNNVYVGMGATIMTGVKNVGSNSLIGAGSVVIRDVPENTVVAGNPARILRKNNHKST